MPIEEKIADIFAKREAFINGSISTLDANTKRAAEKLLDAILKEYAEKMVVVDGKIVWSAQNVKLISELDKIIDKFQGYLQNNVLAPVAQDMIATTEFSRAYFTTIGFKAATLDQVGKSLESLNRTIGIGADGTLLKGGYLDNLSQVGTVRDEIKQQVVNSIAQKQDFRSFQKSMKNLIVGNDKVNGKLQSYYQQYTHDVYWSVANSRDNLYALQLGLDWFMYGGDIMATTRPFCRKKVGKVFSRKEAKAWEKETWAGKNEPYDPFVLPGGYNCRHHLQWISVEMARRYRIDIPK
jgi:hypothetical protein